MHVHVDHQCPECGASIHADIDGDQIRIDPNSEDSRDAQLAGPATHKVAVIWSCGECQYAGGATAIIERTTLDQFGSYDWVQTIDGEDCCLHVDVDRTGPITYGARGKIP